jgi:hypothetical protein
VVNIFAGRSVAVTLCACLTSTAQAVAVYHVGNSLTWDSQPYAIDNIATSSGYEHEFGFHIRCNSSLGQITASPTSVCVAPTAFGTYTQALPRNAWDAVTLQPFPAGGATLASEASAALDLIATTRSNTTNTDTHFYIYSPWGPRGDILGDLTAEVIDDDDTAMGYRLDHARLVYERVKAQTDARVFVIPVGEVFHRLALAIDQGEFDGYTATNQLYRDTIHASNGLGRYAASVTTFAVLYGDDLTGVSSTGLGPEASTFVNGVILDVLDDDLELVGLPEPGTGMVIAAIGLVVLRRKR